MEAYWYFDFASPFAYLQLAKAQEWRSRLPLTPVPIVARVLSREGGEHAAAGIAVEESIEGFVRWRAKTVGLTLTFPPAYPFNSIAALRMCVAGGGGWPVIDAIFNHIWRDGHSGATPEELKPVSAKFGINTLGTTGGAFDSGAKVRANTEAARALGIAGVPTVRAGSRLFHGPNSASEFDDWLAAPGLRRSA